MNIPNIFRVSKSEIFFVVAISFIAVGVWYQNDVCVQVCDPCEEFMIDTDFIPNQTGNIIMTVNVTKSNNITNISTNNNKP